MMLKLFLKCNTVFLQTTVVQRLAAVNFSSYAMLRQRLKKALPRDWLRD